MEPENQPGKGDSFWKPSFSGSMLNFGCVLQVIVLFFFLLFFKALQKKTDACLLAVEKLKKEIMERLRQAEAVKRAVG